MRHVLTEVHDGELVFCILSELHVVMRWITLMKLATIAALIAF